MYGTCTHLYNREDPLIFLEMAQVAVKEPLQSRNSGITDVILPIPQSNGTSHRNHHSHNKRHSHKSPPLASTHKQNGQQRFSITTIPMLFGEKYTPETRGKLQDYYKIKEKIGTGNYSIVRRAINRKTKVQVAVKIIKKSDLSSKELKIVSTPSFGFPPSFCVPSTNLCFVVWTVQNL